MTCCDGGMMGGWGMIMMLLWFVLVAGGIALIIWAVARSIRSNRGTDQTDSERGALGALRERFARGEIDEAEYQERRRVLLEDDQT